MLKCCGFAGLDWGLYVVGYLGDAWMDLVHGNGADLLYLCVKGGSRGGC